MTCNENNSEQGDQRAKITTSIGFSFFFFSVSAIKLLLRSFVFRTAIYIEKWLDGKRKKKKTRRRNTRRVFRIVYLIDQRWSSRHTRPPVSNLSVACPSVCLSVSFIHSFNGMEWRAIQKMKAKKIKQNRKEIICYEERTSRVSIV